jgi:hypothetical protein
LPHPQFFYALTHLVALLFRFTLEQELYLACVFHNLLLFLSALFLYYSNKLLGIFTPGLLASFCTLLFVGSLFLTQSFWSVDSPNKLHSWDRVPAPRGGRGGSASDMGRCQLRPVCQSPGSIASGILLPNDVAGYGICRHVSYQRGGLVSPAHEKSSSSISPFGIALAIGGALEGRPRQSRILRIATGG